MDVLNVISYSAMYIVYKFPLPTRNVRCIIAYIGRNYAAVYIIATIV